VILHTAEGVVGLDERGEGPPLLLLHGFPHDRTLWAPQVADDALRVRRIAPDLPGFGESGPTDEASFDRWADWTAALLDALRIERAIIGGLSMGGYLAFAVWRRHRHRVLGLVLADTRAGADSEEGRAKRREMQGLALAEGAGAVADRMITGMVGKTTRAERPAVVASLEAMMRRAPIPAITDALGALMDREDSTPTLASISVPTLVLCGEEDTLTPVAESRALHAGIAGSTLGLIPRAGHASNLEDPIAFDGLLSRFLTATIRRTPH
jgi:pimeloyl-ACP methyl ester carboxylesterase